MPHLHVIVIRLARVSSDLLALLLKFLANLLFYNTTLDPLSMWLLYVTLNVVKSFLVSFPYSLIYSGPSGLLTVPCIQHLLFTWPKRNMCLCFVNRWMLDRKKNSCIHLPRDAELYFTGRNIVNGGNIAHIYMPMLHSSFLKNESHGYSEKGVSGEKCYRREMTNYAAFWELKKNCRLNVKID